jgi:hypothetical protein
MLIPWKTNRSQLNACLSFLKKDTGYSLLWKISDAEKNCEFDLTAEFLKFSTVIADLDQDDVAETIIQYKLACRSDVSPAQMKLIMHEGESKYALRGLMWVKSAENDRFTVTEKTVNLESMPGSNAGDEWEKNYGKYRSEKDFANAPPSFVKFARKQWLKYAIESFE